MEYSVDLLHVKDSREDKKWLVDGGALLSIIPPTPAQRNAGPNGTRLQAANGTNIDCLMAPYTAANSGKQPVARRGLYIAR